MDIRQTTSDRLRDATVSEGASLHDVMVSFEQSSCAIALIVNAAGRLVGVATDGDVRRALLRGDDLAAGVESCTRRDFSSVRPDASRSDVLDLMKAMRISGLPVLDAEGRVVGLHLLQELLGSALRPNWAVVMAGGRGTRLGGLTATVPKPMLRVAGRPIIERIVLQLVSHGIRRIFIAVNYLAPVIEEHLGDGSAFGCRIEYLRETRPLGSGGALSLLPDRPAEPVLVVNGDVVTQADLGALIDRHEAGSGAMTVAVKQFQYTVPFGCVDAEDGRVTRFSEKPAFVHTINAGMYVLAPSVVARMPKDAEMPLTQLIEDCLRRGEAVGAFEIHEDWIDIGRKSELRRAREGS